MVTRPVRTLNSSRPRGSGVARTARRGLIHPKSPRNERHVIIGEGFAGRGWFRGPGVATGPERTPYSENSTTLRRSLIVTPIAAIVTQAIAATSLASRPWLSSTAPATAAATGSIAMTMP